MAETAPPPPSSRSIFTVPQPIRSLFNHFPLQTYDADALPLTTTSLPTNTSSSSSSSNLPRLYIFTNPALPPSSPSPNPTCLKHQTHLLLSKIEFLAVPSNNHASPSGALPFLAVPENSGHAERNWTSGKIGGFARENGKIKVGDVEDVRGEGYRALISTAIRPAWLHDLYLLPENAAVLSKLYLPSSLPSSITLPSLCSSATAQILQTLYPSSTPSLPSSLPIDADLLRQNALDALTALNDLLGEDEWFFGSEKPTLFDAEVFAYTWVVLDQELNIETVLKQALEQCEGLKRHRQCVWDLCWGSKP